MTERHRVIPAAFVVVEERHRLLLQRRKNTGFHDGEYEVATGHVEEGETPAMAGARELREETGLITRPDDLELFHIITNDYETADKPYLYFFFHVAMSACAGKFEIQEPEKCDSMEFFQISELPRLVPHVAQALGYLGSRTVTFSSINEH